MKVNWKLKSINNWSWLMMKVNWKLKSINDWSWLMIKVVSLLKSIDDKVLLTNELTNELMDNAISRVAFATENMSKWLQFVH